MSNCLIISDVFVAFLFWMETRDCQFNHVMTKERLQLMEPWKITFIRLEMNH